MTQTVAQRATAHVSKAGALVAALLMLVLAGCAPAEETVTTFHNSEDGIEMTLTYYATGDNVTKQTTVNVIDYAALGVEDEAQAREFFDPMVAQFQGIDGVEHAFEYGADSVTETMSIDYSVANVEEVAGLTGTSFEGDVSEGARISLAESIKVLEAQGFTQAE